MRRNVPFCLNLRETAIHEQFRSADVATVVGREKDDGLGNLFRLSQPSKWNGVRKHLDPFQSGFCGCEQFIQSRCIGGTRRHSINPNVAMLQVRGPCARERTDCSFRRAVNAVGRQPFTRDNRCIEDDGGSIWHQRKYFLNGKKEAFDIDVEDRVIKLLRYLAQRGIFRNTGIREDDVESALLALDLRSEPLQIVEIRDISRNGRYIFPDFLRGLG